VTLQTWSDIWFNEGWANWSEWYWQFSENGGEDPAAIFDELYAETPDGDWAIAPAVLDGDPANLFASFPTYDRGAMTVQGYREIVGDTVFFQFVKAIAQRFVHGNISTAEFVDFALEWSGLRGDRRALLAEYFQQWLYGQSRPTIVPETFG
jgi:aminopeptidase N